MTADRLIVAGRAGIGRNVRDTRGKIIEQKIKRTHFLVDGQKVDVGLLHWQQEHEGVALVADSSGTSTSMYERTETNERRNKVM